MSQPDVSLLIPCYNAERFLPRLAESIRHSTVPFAEVVLYDDGSTDNTRTTARALGLRIIEGNRNEGAASARNHLADAARCDWIHFHDADDLLEPRFLEVLGPRCDATHDVVGCDADWIDDGGSRVLIAWRYDAAALASDPCRYLLTHPMSLNNTIIRREAWKSVGGCDPSLRMWEDSDVHVRLARHGARFIHVAEVHSRATRHGGSFSHDYRKSWGFRLATLEKYAGTFPQDYRPELADSLETCARELLRHDDVSAAKRAVTLALRLGGNPPTTGNPLLRLAKVLVGPVFALRLQELARKRSSS